MDATGGTVHTFSQEVTPVKKPLILVSLLACADTASAQQREYVVPGHQTHRDNWGYYVTKYQDAEKALVCAGFVGLNPRQVGGGAKPVAYIRIRRSSTQPRSMRRCAGVVPNCAVTSSSPRTRSGTQTTSASAPHAESEQA